MLQVDLNKTDNTFIVPAPQASTALRFLNGAISGGIATILTNPFDVARTRLQASRASAENLGHKRLIETMQCIRKAGWRDGYMRGLGPNLVAGSLSRSLYLASYGKIKACISEVTSSPVVVSGGAALATSLSLTTIMNPFYVLRVRLQLEPGVNLFNLARNIYINEGTNGFFRGASTSIIGRSLESVCYFVIYEHLKRNNIRNNCDSLNSVVGLQFFTTSMWARFCAALLTYPYNVVVTHIREVNAKTGKHEYSGTFKTFKKIWKLEGIRGFYYGLSPHVIRVVPNTGITFLFYEMLARACGYST